MNYFEVLDISIEDLQGQDENTINRLVSTAHTKHYHKTIGAYANVPRTDGRTQAQWQVILNEAKATLIDPQKRRTYIAELTQKTEFPKAPSGGNVHAIFTFPNGDQASTPEQLAHLIDQNWEEAKTLFYSGFIPLWLKSTEQTQLARSATDITNQYSSKQDIGLEMLVQELDPQIGKPKLKTNRSRIDFSRIDTDNQKTIDLEITNIGRGFLYGNVRMPSNISWLQISETEIQGEGVISVEFDANRLTSNKTHETTLVINTNGGIVRVPTSCDVSPATTEILPDVNTKDELGWTPLHSAAISNDYEEAEMLINNNADINAEDNRGDTPLHHAVRQDAHEAAEILLKYGADINAQNDHSETPLYRAVRQDAFEIVEVLLNYGADINEKDEYEQTLLHQAASHDAHKAAEILLKNGADINAESSLHGTPLYAAVVPNAYKTAEVLLKYGADVNTQKNVGTPLHSAASHDAHETAEVLLKYGADVNTQNTVGDTSLHSTARRNKYMTAEVLLNHGADINLENISGKTPLDIAVEENATETATVLRKYRNRSRTQAAPDVNTKDENGQTPLHLAALVNDYEKVQMLLNSGADVNAKNNSNYTPLHYAANEDAHEIAELLLKNGADIKAQDEYGYTPLGEAIVIIHRMEKCS